MNLTDLPDKIFSIIVNKYLFDDDTWTCYSKPVIYHNSKLVCNRKITKNYFMDQDFNLGLDSNFVTNFCTNQDLNLNLNLDLDLTIQRESKIEIFQKKTFEQQHHPYIFSQIICLEDVTCLHISHIKKLLLCFDRKLNAKLALNVKKLCLRDHWFFGYKIFPNLTELHIKFYDWNRSGFDLSLLPRQLKSLTLLYWQTNPKKKLNFLDLPRLDYFYLDNADCYGYTLIQNFNLYDLVSLPKKLTVLELYENIIKDEDLIHLPPNLVLLYLPKNTLITNAGISCLPEYLRYLALTDNRNVDFKAFTNPQSFPQYLCYVWIPYIIYLQLFNLGGVEILFCHKTIKYNPCWVNNPHFLPDICL
jgi:hypothetical protein